MVDNLKDILLNIPNLELEETQIGNHIYYGHGNFKIGIILYPCRLRVWIDKNNMKIILKSPKANIEIIEQFDSELGRKNFIEKCNLLNHSVN